VLSQTAEGLNTTAISGAVKILLQLCDTYRPTHVAVVFDGHNSWRTRQNQINAATARAEQLQEEIAAAGQETWRLQEQLQRCQALLQRRETAEVAGLLAEYAGVATRRAEQVVTTERQAAERLEAEPDLAFLRQSALGQASDRVAPELAPGAQAAEAAAAAVTEADTEAAARLLEQAVEWELAALEAGKPAVAAITAMASQLAEYPAYKADRPDTVDEIKLALRELPQVESHATSAITARPANPPP
jgi:hypothetical protein